MQTRKINESESERFHQVFSTVLREGFQEYSSALIEFFLTKDFSLESIKNKIADGTYTILVAGEDEQTVGFLVFEKLYGGVSYCPWLGVLKSFRKRGFGRQLVQVWEKEIFDLGGHKLMLLTQAKRNCGFYQKCGFKKEGFEEKSWFGLDAWVFGKIIGGPREEMFLK